MPVRNELVLKPISELLQKSFFIPAYQRGYRWTRRQVSELLDDIGEFQKQSEESPKSVFYCLQPVVVKQRDGEWELVDGQQRLTTIYIILNYLKDIAALLGKESYRLRYETRPNSAAFLEDISEIRHQENIDFFYMYEAKQAIHEWFEARDGTYKLKFLQTLLNDDEAGKNVKVIWYQINERIDTTTVFTRLNLGKIPLTNAELVKALFLKGLKFNENEHYFGQLKIAKEWDEIERALQSDDFWFFMSNEETEANRIEFVLEIVTKQLPSAVQSIPMHDPYYIFLTFSRWLSESSEPIDRDWEHVKRCFMTLREWYEDHTIFHLVGFLVARDVCVKNIKSLFQDCSTKREFRQALVGMVFKKAFPDLVRGDYESRGSLAKAIEGELTQFSYDSGSSKQSLVSVLLLFNIATLLANPKTNARFQFDRFRKESWDIEHIRSVASEMPESKERQKAWLGGVVNYIENEFEEVPDTLSEDLNNILADAKEVQAGETFDTSAFETLFSRVLDVYAPNNNADLDHSIGNLTLLDSFTNRSYKNAIFPIKRNRVIALDKTATFVPLCTKNAFLKYYSDRVGNMMFWDSQDSKNHQQAMTELLTKLFCTEDLIA
ncbi:DUF262 domain-containing protein [Vreelandella rituensis]|uniref:DUF262 domain-containing protein n=1 Tax=Vreelandella rituensis TaxID=2282306 RepID=A0A368TW87_9GAMM|nr:DUF262 domain-containing protein [Halomonas rituensis]RCV89045.1 DUF262 domain-containing protein [Halomonas rituensis]